MCSAGFSVQMMTGTSGFGHSQPACLAGLSSRSFHQHISRRTKLPLRVVPYSNSRSILAVHRSICFPRSPSFAISYLRSAIKLVSAILLTLPTRAMYRFKSELLSPSLPRTTALYFFNPEQLLLASTVMRYHARFAQSPQPVTILEQSTNTSPQAPRLKRFPQHHHPVSVLVRNFQICNRHRALSTRTLSCPHTAHTHKLTLFFPFFQDSICQSKFFFLLFRAITGQLSSIKVRSHDHRWLHRVQTLEIQFAPHRGRL